MAIKNINYDKCVECGRCYDVCPLDVLRKIGSQVYIRYPSDCISCFQCVFVCKTDALEVDHLRATPIPVPWG